MCGRNSDVMSLVADFLVASLVVLCFYLILYCDGTSQMHPGGSVVRYAPRRAAPLQQAAPPQWASPWAPQWGPPQWAPPGVLQVPPQWAPPGVLQVSPQWAPPGVRQVSPQWISPQWGMPQRQHFQSGPAPHLLPGSGPAYPKDHAPSQRGLINQAYPGAFDDFGQHGGEYVAEGHVDADAADQLYEGNPFSDSRTRRSQGAVCFDDDADDSVFGVDEKIAYQGRFRNDPVRETAGTMNRRTNMDFYLRAEVEERENDVWWGRHEY